MIAKKSLVHRVKGNISNDETFKNLNLKTALFIVVTITLFQLAEKFNDVFFYVGIIVLLVGLLLIEEEQIMFFYVVVASSNRLMNVSNIPLLPVIPIVYFVRKYFFKKNYKKSGLDTQVLAAFIMLGLYSLRYFFKNYSFDNLLICVKLFFAFIMMIDFVERCKSKEEIRNRINMLIFYFSLGITITCLISMIFEGSAESAERFVISEKSGTNILSIYIVSGISASIVAILSENSAVFKKTIGIMIIPMVYIGILTQSRTYVVLIIINFIWAVMFGMAKKKTRNGILIFLAILIFVAVFYIFFGKTTQLYGLIETIIDRFVNPRNDDISGGRTDIWKLYIRTLFRSKKFIFLGSDTPLLDSAGEISAHNMYIEILFGWGVIGGIVVVYLYYLMLKKVKHAFVKCGLGKASFMGSVALLSCLIGGMSSHSLLGAMPTVEFYIGVCCIYYAIYDPKGKLDIKKRMTHTAPLYRRTVINSKYK